MRMKVAGAIVAIGFGFAGAAIAMDNKMASGGDIAEPIPARQELMKMNGAAMKAASAMAKGEAPYNEAEAAGAMAKIKDDLEQFPALFPEGSAEGDTRASPKIWEDMDGFKAAAAKAAEDAAAAQQAAAQGPEAFAAALGKVGSNCSSCHEKFRLPSS